MTSAPNPTFRFPKFLRRLAGAAALMTAIGLTMGSAPMLTGCCRATTTAISQLQQCRADIKAELGVDSTIHYTTFNATRIVSAQLASMPPGDVATNRAKVETIVRRHFPDVDIVRVQADMSRSTGGGGATQPIL